MFAIKVLDSRQQIVGHLPMEISRSCFFLTLRGAALSCIINDTKYYRSPIVQGGLEILCNLRVHMVPTSHNRAIAAHFQTLVGKFYSEPTDEMVMGSFDEEEPKKKQKKIQTTNVADIRSFFKKKWISILCISLSKSYFLYPPFTLTFIKMDKMNLKAK